MRRLIRSLGNLRQIRRSLRASDGAFANLAPVRTLRSIFSWQPQSANRLQESDKKANALRFRRTFGAQASVTVRPEISPHHQLSFDSKKIYVPWTEGVTSSFHNVWLRDSCQCEHCLHPITKQRLLDTFAIPENVRPASVEPVEQGLKIIWFNDDHESFYPWDWLHLHSYQPVIERRLPFIKTFWERKDIEGKPPVVKYADVMAEGDYGVAEWTSKIQDYGVCFVEGVPATPQDTENLINRISFARNTHYGGFWDFTSDLAKNDTAYTDLALGLHTDGTYFTDPPGLQLLHCLHHEGSGGESILADGFKAARILREESPNAYKVLSRIRIPSHSAGNENVCITPALSSRPILNHDEVTGELTQVRWNNDDRSTMDKWSGDPDVDVLEFYDAIRKWHAIITRPEIEYRFKLKPGMPMIFDNWRVMHGRAAFTGERRLCGAYVNMDDFISRLRLTNFGRDAVLKSL
ncbi:hypothetical protein V1514DRAFT_338211 [Lipomyces japonicus]|uniref:uncharacterized protein n=1 Tax=Lipomyces japonicus TaxID=56871 RepID=UPI0034CFC111